MNILLLKYLYEGLADGVPKFKYVQLKWLNQHTIWLLAIWPNV